ncbi:hypothetical protein Tco_0941675 [Tanacetum coccineum]|uniref:Uncharacterized protein n=1 Tax=Tanacetum coccineum TaxID=301880 RepID=A0ABQ5DRK9_9ASTR
MTGYNGRASSKYADLHKVHKETVRSELRMAIVQQSMEMDIWEIKEKLPERREQMRIYEEDKRLAQGYGGENLPQTDNILKNLNSEDISTCIGSSKSANNQENRITIGAGDQSRVTEKDVPSHGPRKQQLGGLIFGAEVEIPVGFDLRTFEGLHCDLSRGQERRTWNPGINHHPSERKGNSSLNSFIESIIKSNHVFQHFRPNDDQHERRGVQRRVWDPGITHGDILKQHLENKGIIYSLLDKKEEAEEQFLTYQSLLPDEFPQREFLDDVVLAAKTEIRQKRKNMVKPEFSMKK